MTQSVDELATARTGDKGDTLILGVVARDAAAFATLEAGLTADMVAAHYGLAAGQVTRTVLRQLQGFSFSLPGLLGGGVSGAPNLDGHGKALSYHLLTLRL